MNQKRLGCLTPGGLIALAISLISVGASYGLSGNRMFSPGELSSFTSGVQIGGITSHAELEDQCQDCHPAPWRKKGMADLCLDCHIQIKSQLADNQSLHGAVTHNLESGDCRQCHTDHLGSAAGMTIYDGEDFPHDLVGFSLLSHQQIDWEREINCEDCHPSTFSSFSTLACSDCHIEINKKFTQAHIAVFDISCTACHDGIESINRSYDHSRADFPLVGAHLETACENCHQGAKDLDMFKSAPRSCASCHLAQDPHGGSLGSICEDCHDPAAWSPAVFGHEQTGFTLDGSHQDLSCGGCHLDPTFQGQDPACVSCHLDDDEHQNQLGSDCATCHSTTAWSDVVFDHSGPYSENCSACHLDDSPQNHYLGQCSACHTTSGWLPASFDHAAAQATDCLGCHIPDQPQNHFPGQCSICHFTSKWKPANINHTFPISHEGAGGVCTKCHTTSNYFAYTCYGCHEHNKTEVKKEHEGISNLDNCIRCHWDGRKHDDGGDGEDDD